jgi:hypothetical protein
MGQENWSMTHGFYAQMGGFAVDFMSEGLGDNLNCEIGYVQTDSIRRYLKQGRLNPNTWITEKEIQDKGKSDSLGKSLTILQLSWLLVQCSARLVQHLPLTTLELSTLAYIPCALVIYYLWWDKPYEINTPTHLDLHPIGTFTTDSSSSTSYISLKSSQGGVGSTVLDGGGTESQHSPPGPVERHRAAKRAPRIVKPTIQRLTQACMNRDRLHPTFRPIAPMG